MSTITTPTVCRYYSLTEEGKVQYCGSHFAWDDHTDRQGDGESEAAAFLEVSRENGATVERVNLDVQGADVSTDHIRAYRCDFEGEPTCYFALAVVPAVSYWCEHLEITVVV